MWRRAHALYFRPALGTLAAAFLFDAANRALPLVSRPDMRPRSHR